MVSNGKHSYMINNWFGAANDQTACMYRTESRDLWLEKIQEFRVKYGLTNDNSRVVIRDGITVFSYASTPTGLAALKSIPMMTSPIAIGKAF